MKIIVLNRKTCVFAVVVAALSIALLVSLINLVPKAVTAAASNRVLPIYSVEKQDKIASLSFDAAWGNEDTQKLIDILNKYHVHATFFVVGGWVEKYPDSVKALSNAGNEVMNHSNTHPHMTKLSRDDMLKQISTCDNKIQKITGKKPILFRPPYGDYNNALVETVQASNHYAIQWSVDSLDWKGIGADQISKNVLTKVKPGSIILFHNAAKHTPEALPGIIENLQKQGYKLIPVSELIYKDNYTIDVAGQQHSNAASAASSQKASSSLNQKTLSSSGKSTAASSSHK